MVRLGLPSWASDGRSSGRLDHGSIGCLGSLLRIYGRARHVGRLRWLAYAEFLWLVLQIASGNVWSSYGFRLAEASYRPSGGSPLPTYVTAARRSLGVSSDSCEAYGRAP